ncbi:AfsR/SARP family transcriptional regulator [Actinoplanes sp. NPDC048796]|uniref:AfsR/SARP family transcriptional regulator n=1 Tax=unclassified Actinoplanes TaxID=2626549 RepID=UPI0033EB7E85
MWELKVLGPLEIRFEGRACRLTAPKMREVFALLLLHPNETVSVPAIIREVWDEDVPSSAVTTIQTYVYHLRKRLRQTAPHDDGCRLLTQHPGYTLRVPDAALDLTEFTQLVARGQADAEQGRHAGAVEHLRQALRLWRGPALDDVSKGRQLETDVARLEEERIRATELLVAAEMQLGRHREIVPQLQTLVSSYPLNEWFHEQLIIALHRSSRRGDALRAYQNARRILDEELGLDPSPQMERLQLEVLAGSTH